jgi:hypothetical protein
VAETITISYLTDGDVTNSLSLTVHPAAETLNPVYTALTGPVGFTALPSNAGAISTARGSNTAAFTITSGSATALDPGTGELTLQGSGTVTVSLSITTAGNVITHSGIRMDIFKLPYVEKLKPSAIAEARHLEARRNQRPHLKMTDEAWTIIKPQLEKRWPPEEVAQWLKEKYPDSAITYFST